MSTPLPTLAQGNRFQRAYARWAEPYYARLTAEQQAEARRLDAWLYSRRSAGLWIGLVCAIGGSALGLASAGLPPWLAVVLSLAVWVSLSVAALGTWMRPDQFTARRLARVGTLTLAGMVSGLLMGFLAGRIAKRGRLDLDTLGQALIDLAWRAMPALLALSVAMVALVWLVASSRRWQIQRELAELRLVQERDAAAREAAEAQLKLLRAQIQPHFIFNTLSALQHWVDTGDARAPGLLRALTGFLRGSTELLGRDEVSLGEEAAMVGHYLAIQRARLGERLSSTVEIAPGADAVRLPPGVLLTLVENAVEHGVAPALSGGAVHVQARREGATVRLCVDDDGVGLGEAFREGLGLTNCRQRLAHAYGERASLRLEALEVGTRACVTLPAENGGAAAPEQRTDR